MKLFLSFGIFSAATFLLFVHSLNAEAVSTENLSFEQWCLQKNSLSPETKNTIDVLLKKSGTQDCKVADKNLNSLSELKLEKKQFSDIRPIASLKNLTKLGLDNNQISDIQPIASLKKLTGIYP